MAKYDRLIRRARKQALRRARRFGFGALSKADQYAVGRPNKRGQPIPPVGYRW